MKTKIRAGLRMLAIVGMALLLAGCFRVNMDLEISPENTVAPTASILSIGVPTNSWIKSMS